MVLAIALVAWPIDVAGHFKLIWIPLFLSILIWVFVLLIIGVVVALVSNVRKKLGELRPGRLGERFPVWPGLFLRLGQFQLTN